MASKIKVDTIENVAGSGNVSLGSGHNLVVPGNITGQGTAAITSNATVGGTLGVTGATTTAGITSSAAHTVTTTTHANASVFKTTGHTQIMLQDTDASSNDQFWGLQNSGGDFNILTCNDDRASGFVTPMTITQAGQVTMPNQPAFKQGVDNKNATGSDRVISGNNGDTFTYSARDNHNVGGHWSSTTGRFTCPVAGTYVFYCSLMRNGNNGTVLENRIKKNGGLMYARAYAGAYTASYQQSMLVTTTVCAVNDYIEFFVQGTTSIYQDDTYLGGYLLG